MPIVMALAICFAPIALDVCQAACAIPVAAVIAGPASHAHAHSQHASASGHHHANEPMASSEVAARWLQGLPHTCSHTDELPESAGACSQLLVSSPAVIASALDLAVPTLGIAKRHERFHSIVSLRLTLTRQLRV